MGFSFNGLSAEVTISGDVASSSSALEVTAVSQQGASTGATIATVSAGKIWKIYGWTLQVTGVQRVDLTMGGEVVDSVYQNISSKSLDAPIKLTAGETIVTSLPGASSWFITFYYIEEDA